MAEIIHAESFILQIALGQEQWILPRCWSKQTTPNYGRCTYPVADSSFRDVKMLGWMRCASDGGIFCQAPCYVCLLRSSHQYSRRGHLPVWHLHRPGQRCGTTGSRVCRSARRSSEMIDSRIWFSEQGDHSTLFRIVKYIYIYTETCIYCRYIHFESSVTSGFLRGF